jgi:hypothetical protein
MGILKDLSIRIFGLEFFITATILRMEGLNNEDSMLLGRLWLWQVKVHHDKSMGENLLRCTTQDIKGLVLITILFYLIF